MILVEALGVGLVQKGIGVMVLVKDVDVLVVMMVCVSLVWPARIHQLVQDVVHAHLDIEEMVLRMGVKDLVVLKILASVE